MEEAKAAQHEQRTAELSAEQTAEPEPAADAKPEPAVGAIKPPIKKNDPELVRIHPPSCALLSFHTP